MYNQLLNVPMYNGLKVLKYDPRIDTAINVNFFQTQKTIVFKIGNIF